tara:strand:+ start:321 stop:1304 length:984 start_codon:yes stop_codon:yes gene_type:complete
MKRALLGIAILLSVLKVSAQQDAQFSQNMFISAPINPGAVGIRGMHCFDLVAREQWLGFEGRPETGLLSYNGPIGQMSNFGIGGVLVYDKIGFENNIFFKVSGAHHIDIGSDGGKLGIGVDFGIIQKGFSGIVKAVDPTDPTVAINGTNDMGFDLGVGAFYYSPKLYFGVSGQKLLPQKMKFGSAEPRVRPHAYITAGYNVEGEMVSLRPNMLVKTDFTSTQVDVNLTAFFSETKFWLGASYRVQDAIVANVGYKIGPNTKVGIAYDYTTQGLKKKGTFNSWDEQGNVANTDNNNRSVGSIELYFGHCIIPPPPRGFDTYVDPLFLQ